MAATKTGIIKKKDKPERDGDQKSIITCQDNTVFKGKDLAARLLRIQQKQVYGQRHKILTYNFNSILKAVIS